MGKHILAPNQRRHYFVTIEHGPKHITQYGAKITTWRCLCDCGKEFITPGKQILQGTRKSCGCKNKNSPIGDREFIRNKRWGHYRYGAKTRGLEWDLTRDQFTDYLFGRCIYCGSPPNYEVTTQNHTYAVNGIDRVDNNKGYTIDNCVSCCWVCNAAKSNKSISDFDAWIQRIINHYETSSASDTIN